MAASKVTKIKATEPEDVAAQIETLRADIAQLAALMKDLGEQRAQDLKDAAQQKLDEARSRGQDSVEALRAEAQKLTAEAERFAAEKPGTALAIAAGIGFLFGLWTTRR